MCAVVAGQPLRTIPEIAEELNNIMQTKNGRRRGPSFVGEQSKVIMNQIKGWINEELESLKQQLDLLEMSRWDMSVERREWDSIEANFNNTEFDLEKIMDQLQIIPSGQEPAELVESYIISLGAYMRNIIKLSTLTDKIDRRSNDLLKYRDSLLDLLTRFGQQTRSQTT
jgi:hypothetical protein